MTGRGPGFVTAAVTTLALGLVPIAGAATTTLVQRPGLAGCISTGATGVCAPGRGLTGASGVAISPNGANAYVASDSGNALAIFDRAADGTLIQKPGVAGCVSQTGAGPCADGRALYGATDVAVSPDGASVYVSTYTSHAIATFDRASDGTLTEKAGLAGCVSSFVTGPYIFPGGDECTVSAALGAVMAVVVSRDGANVYAVTGANTLVVFDRAPDGTITQKAGNAGCINDIAEYGTGSCVDGRGLRGPSGVVVSPDGGSVYVSSVTGNALAVFDRAADGTLTQKAGTAGCVGDTAGTDACAVGRALLQPGSVALSPDGANVYVGSFGSAAVAAFDRATDGTLTQKPGAAGCVSSLATGGACASATLLNGPTSVTVSPDGANAYVTTNPTFSYQVPDGGLAVFDRAADGSLTQKPGQAGCVYQGIDDDRCVEGRGVVRASAIVVSPNSANAYVAAPGSNAVATFDMGPFVAPAPPPAPPGAPADPRPVLSRLSIAPASFRALTAGTSIVARRGSRVAYTLSEPAAVRFTVQRARTGRRVGGRCAALTRANRGAKRCERYGTLAGSFAITAKTGRNTLRFSGRLRARALAPGRYRLRAVARDAAHQASREKVARFTIRRR
jgi:DNA-binding beta-propeller fold protein YncE